MHVLILCQGFPPANLTGARRPYHLARRLVEKGHRVTVLCDSISTHDQWTADLQGIAIHRFPRVQVPRDSTGSARIAWKIHKWLTGHTLFDTFAGLWGDLFLPPNPRAHIDLTAVDIMSRIERPSIILASGPPWVYFLYAQELARSWHVPLSLDYRDPWNISDPSVALSAIHRGKGSRGRIVRMRQLWLERSIGRGAACITAATGPFLANTMNIIGALPSLTVQNGTSLRAPFRKRPQAKVKIVHTGSLYEEQEWELVRDGLRQLQAYRPDISNLLDVSFYGAQLAGNGKRFLSTISDLKELACVHFEPRIGREEALFEQANADLLLNVGFKNKNGILPLKFLEYLGSRTPIIQISTGNDLPEQIIAATRSGYHLKKSDDFCSFIQTFIDNRYQRVENHIIPDEYELLQNTWNARMDQWITFIEKFCKN